MEMNSIAENATGQAVDVMAEAEARVVKYGCPLWARKDTIRRRIAEAPDNWFLRYMAGEKYGRGWRKMAEGDTGAVLFHAPTVLVAIETERYKRQYNYKPEPKLKQPIAKERARG